MPVTVSLKKGLLKDFEHHAQTAFPNEACGLLVGYWEPDHIIIERFEPSPNRADEPDKGFEIDTGIQATLQRSLRGTDHHMIGVWHSHPSGDPNPSEIDSLAAFEPDFIWIVTSSGTAQSKTTLQLAPAVSGEDFRPVTVQLV